MQKSVGNPTWYIFVIIACYFITWLSVKLVGNSRCKLVFLHTSLITLIGAVLVLFKDSWWYDTILCYAFGFFFSQYKSEIEPLLKSRWSLKAFGYVVMFIGLYAIANYTHIPRPVSFNLCAMSFALLVVMLSLKIKVGNKAIIWCGEHLFPIYFYQEIFANVLGHMTSIDAKIPFAYILLSMLLTLVVAKFYRYWAIKLK